MRRPLCTILASFALIPNLLEAQDSKSQSSRPEVLSTSDADATAVDLLQQSHNLSQQLPVSTRLMNLLPRQAEMVSRLRPDLGQEWANELFTLAAQAKGAQRSITQNAAMLILIRLNPDRALESLHSLNIEEPVPKWTTRHNPRCYSPLPNRPTPGLSQHGSYPERRSKEIRIGSVGEGWKAG